MKTTKQWEEEVMESVSATFSERSTMGIVEDMLRTFSARLAEIEKEAAAELEDVDDMDPAWIYGFNDHRQEVADLFAQLKK
jgi:hypothetical protein